MKNDKYVITTDYKSGGLFSAVFSFECDLEAFKSMDKTDLLHSYLVSQIILNFDNDNYESNFSQPYFLSDTAETVKNVVSSVKKQAGGNKFNQKLEKTLKAIEEQFPLETQQIKEIVKDDTQIVCTSFFVPQILNQLIQEYELSECKKCKYLVGINLNEFVNSSVGRNQAVLIDFISYWNSKKPKLKASRQIQARTEELKNTIKQTLQLNMLSSGDFAKYLEAKNKQNDVNNPEKEEGTTPEN